MIRMGKRNALLFVVQTHLASFHPLSFLFPLIFGSLFLSFHFSVVKNFWSSLVDGPHILPTIEKNSMLVLDFECLHFGYLIFDSLLLPFISLIQALLVVIIESLT